jgi:hypothetical protein
MNNIGEAYEFHAKEVVQNNDLGTGGMGDLDFGGGWSDAK